MMMRGVARGLGEASGSEEGGEGERTRVEVDPGRRCPLQVA